MSSPFDNLIDAHTRTSALRDGALVDVTGTATEFGFRTHVAVTAAVHADCVTWTDADTDRTGWIQDEAGRTADVLWMAHRATSGDRKEVPFVVYRVPRTTHVRPDSDDEGAEPVRLVARLGADDTGRPCWTITHPHED